MPEIARSLLADAVYLENDGITIDGVSFWGSPYTPEFMNWAFMYPRSGAGKRIWDLIPSPLDVLITHGPPRGILEKAISNDSIANHFDLRSSASYSIRACRYVLCLTRGGCSGSFLGIESGSSPAEAPAQGRVAATEP
jgi:hypothetical protein